MAVDGADPGLASPNRHLVNSSLVGVTRFSGSFGLSRALSGVLPHVG